MGIMNTDTGQLIDMPDWEDLKKELTLKKAKVFKEVSHATPGQIKRKLVRLTDKCACGSGKKFKNCCFTGGVNKLKTKAFKRR